MPAGQELRNMFIRTAQPGLWFIAGSLAQCRNRLQIPGPPDRELCEVGLLPRALADDEASAGAGRPWGWRLTAC